MSTRRTTLGAAAALGLTLLAPTSVATAAGETCRGEAATIVGERTKVIAGTEGRDVVVTNGSSKVDTFGGDDLVCVTGRDGRSGTTYGISIDTGAGNDVVDGTAARSWGVDLRLGEGADRFEGGASDDQVLAGAITFVNGEVVYVDGDTDVLIGGGGDDSLRSGQDGAANGDLLLGDGGDDSLSFTGVRAEGSLIDGGAGSDSLGLALSAGAHVLDNVGGALQRDGALMRTWTQVERFYVSAVAGATLDVRGSDEAETVWLSDPVPVVAALGGGDDTFAVPAVLPAGSSLAGGDGRDRFDFGIEDGSVEWDLRSGTVRSGDTTFSAAGFEDGFVSAPRTRLVGTGGPNDLSANSCDARIDARNGPDSVSIHSDGTFEEFDTCTGSTVLVGGRGHDRISSRAGSEDRMVGGRGNDMFYAVGGDDAVFGGPGRDAAELGPGNDRFFGGPGRDTVDGEQGRDSCRAERRTSCER
ncbi:hypothetical protein EUA06_12350 [Nocardioides glacieisoli]|uniref:Calcium-binding protein n=1 Tax=Nocardioides glacieisoli TaxID=1168730 RepID=A0A4Q2RN30_9ACTN|nr:hypothetical protein [Nocardioides glacieisoli]RYB90177.1 hypothetical protein EUA06_12350 [Nocardioides glacieisoli]